MEKYKFEGDFAEMVYELYKIDWMRRVSRQQESDLTMDWLEAKVYGEISPYINLDEYIFEYGYNQGIYVCYEEFLEHEYQDREYISSLLYGKEELIEMYDDDICNRMD